MWLILFALQICDVCRSDRGLVLRVTCVQFRIYVSLGLCARRVWLILFALKICDICRSDRGLGLRVTCVQSRIYILYHWCRGQHLSSYVRICDCLSYIYTVCLFILWFQFIHDISTVCLHFICEADCAGGCGPVCAVAFTSVMW